MCKHTHLNQVSFWEMPAHHYQANTHMDAVCLRQGSTLPAFHKQCPLISIAQRETLLSHPGPLGDMQISSSLPSPNA